MLDKLGLVCSA